MNDAPERIWVENLNSHWMKWPNADLEKPTDPHSTRIEYIRKYIVDKEKQEALKPIREVYEEYKDIAKGNGFNAEEFEYSHVGAVHFKKLWQAIKTALQTKEK